MVMWLHKVWRKISLKMANKRLYRHYTLINRYVSMLQFAITSDTKMCWDVILIRVPKSVEEIYMTLKCGDYNTYSSGKHWREFLVVLDDFYVEYFNSRLTNRSLPSKEEVQNLIHKMRDLNVKHACYLPKYTRKNRYAFA